MSERLFDEGTTKWAAPPRRSVVREMSSRRGGDHNMASAPHGAHGGQSTSTLATMLKPYKTYIILGVAFLAVAIAYQLYSRRASRQKEADQVERGLANIDGAIKGAAATGANNNGVDGEGRPKLEVSPEVIETLQQQVLTYQSQVAELEAALDQSNNLLQQQIRMASPQMDPVTAQMMAAQQQQQQQQGASMPMGGGGLDFSGLHGQMPPPGYASGPPPPLGFAGGGMPTRTGPPPGSRNGGGNGVSQQQQQPGMGAFAGGPMDGGPMPAISGMGSNMGGMDF